MITVTRLRIVRQRHRISLSELAKAAEVSTQQMSRLELGDVRGTAFQERKVTEAMRTVIASRKVALRRLEQDCDTHGGKLLEQLEVERDEL